MCTPRQRSSALYGLRQAGTGNSHGASCSGSSDTTRLAGAKPDPVQMHALSAMIIRSASMSGLCRLGSSLVYMSAAARSSSPCVSVSRTCKGCQCFISNSIKQFKGSGILVCSLALCP